MGISTIDIVDQEHVESGGGSMKKELTIIKLGGSLLTDKLQPYSIHNDVLEAVSREIRDCIDEGLIQSLIIIHGVGSYGHPPVLEHKLHKGFIGPHQLLPLSKTQAIVAEFRAIIVRALQDSGIPVCLMYPSSMMIQEKMRLTRYFLEPLKGFLSLGMVPLLGGDILIDPAMGWSVGSGDQIAVMLAKELGAKHLIFASDIDGVFTTDPKQDPNAELIDTINLNVIKEILERLRSSSKADASGAMHGKLNAISALKNEIQNGLDVAILSMMTSGRLVAFMNGEVTRATRFLVT